MGFFKSTPGSIISDYFMPMESIKGVDSNLVVDVALYDDHLELTQPMGKDTKVILPYERITDVFHGYISEIKEKGHSIGRALAGGFLFGGAGAVVGAISGTGKKTKKKLVLIISYKDKNGDEQFLKFEDTRRYKGAKLAKLLQEKITIDDTDDDGAIVL